MKYVKQVIYAILFIGLVYLFFALVNKEWDPVEWGWFSRVSAPIIAVIGLHDKYNLTIF